MTKIELGCGVRKSHGYIGVDNRYLPGVDHVVDLEKAQLPFSTNSVEEVRASHVLEHISNYIPLVEEIWRVLKPGGKLIVKAPNYKHQNAYTDPTHVRTFTPQSFNFFDSRKVLYRESGWYTTTARFSVDNVDMDEQEIRYELTAFKKMILIVAPPISAHTVRWFGYLSNLGHDVKLAARRLKGNASISLGTDGLSKEDQIDLMPQVLRQKGLDYDVVHAHFSTVYGHVLEAVPDGIRRVLSVWGEDVLEEALRDERRARRLLVALENADAITTTSKHMANFLMERYGINQDRIWTFPWGHLKKYFYERDVAGNRRLSELGIPETGIIILSARACRKENNIDAVIEAFEMSSGGAHLVVLTGELSNSEYADRLMKLTSGNRNITFLRSVSGEELSLLYNRAAVTVSIPFVDQLSTTILESLACGTPVIGSDIEPYRERILNTRNGLLVNPRNLEQIADAMTTAITREFKIEAKEEAKKSVANDAFEDNARTMISVYDQVSIPEQWR